MLAACSPILPALDLSLADPRLWSHFTCSVGSPSEHLLIPLTNYLKQLLLTLHTLGTNTNTRTESDSDKHEKQTH